jgi:hypothetical protein
MYHILYFINLTLIATCTTKIAKTMPIKSVKFIFISERVYIWNILHPRFYEIQLILDLSWRFTIK